MHSHKIGNKLHFVYKTGTSSFSGSVILRNWPLKFPIPIILDNDRLQKMQNIFCGKISKKLHGGNRKHIKVLKKKISKSTDGSFFTPMQTLIVHTSK